MVNELFGVCYELSQRHVGRALSTGTSGIEHLPSCAEAVVEVIHVLGHPVVRSEVCSGELWQLRLGILGLS